jgi:hypothetical protein
MKVIRMLNVSQVSVPVILEGGTTVYLAPSNILENVKVENYDEIARFVKADVSLNEPLEAKRASVSVRHPKRYLKG